MLLYYVCSLRNELHLSTLILYIIVDNLEDWSLHVGQVLIRLRPFRCHVAFTSLTCNLSNVKVTSKVKVKKDTYNVSAQFKQLSLIDS